MKLSEWARRQGISYITAWRWFKAGILPVPARQLPTGTILVDEPLPLTRTVLYARVSSADQKEDLDRQVGRLRKWAADWGIEAEVVAEVGSGLNGRRRKLLRLLKDPSVKLIVVEHRERLVPFGFELVEAALEASSRKIAVMEEGEVTDDLVQDMLEILTSFCARLYGRRSAKNRARRALQVIQE